MIDERRLLERAAQKVSPPERVFDGLVARRSRKRRNERIAAALLALILATAAIGGAIRIFRSAEKAKPANPAITSRNVSTLALRWTADLGSPVSGIGGHTPGIPFPPIAADGAVFAAAGKDVLSIPLSCGPDPCSPSWRGETLVDHLASRIVTAPIVANGEVLVGTVSGSLFAFPEGCGTEGAICGYDWVGEAGSRILSAPVVSGGLAYVVSAGGQLTAFRLGCATGEATCPASWSVPLGPGTAVPFQHAGNAVYAPVVSDGVVYALGFNGRLYAFDAGDGRPLWFGGEGRVCCATRAYAPLVAGDHVYASIGNTLFAFPVGCGDTGAGCTPAWTFSAGGRFLTSPILAGDLVAVSGAANGVPGKVYAFAVSCRANCEPVWTGSAWPPVGEALFDGLVADQGRIYMSSYLTNAAAAFRIDCGSGGATCAPEWTWALTGASSPSVDRLTVSGDLVFAGTAGGRLYALPADCSSECEPIWSSRGAAGFLTSPVVEDGTLITASLDGHLFAFAPRTPVPAATASARRSAAVVYGAVALLIASLFAFRARRRHRFPA